MARILAIIVSVLTVMGIPRCSPSPSFVTETCTAGTFWERQAGIVFPNWCLACYCVSGNLSICARIVRVFADRCNNSTIGGIPVVPVTGTTTTAVPGITTTTGPSAATTTSTARPATTTTVGPPTSTPATVSTAPTTTTIGPPTSAPAVVTTPSTTTVAPG